MTIVEGQIETLKELKESLSRRGITRFSSIGEIRRFVTEYETEKAQLSNRIERELDAECRDMQSNLVGHQQAYSKSKARVRKEIEQEISELREVLSLARERGNRSTFYKIIYFFKIPSLSRRASRLERNLESKVKKKTRSAGKSVARLEKDFETFLENREKLFSERCNKSLADMSRTKEVVDELYTLVAGAIGEASVVNTLRQLSDEYYLINDFSMRFDPPIYNKRENDRIHSVQIDHLLIGRSGIFLLETKNWSKASIQNLDLRSPVKQIQRTSFALFVMLNSDSSLNDLRLARHHWGDKKIPIRNVIVMINEKPREEFKHVKVLSLDELIGYIEYFDQSFDGEEVEGIFEHLKKRMW